MYDDQPISYLDRCAFEGICPCCTYEYADCTCDEDRILEGDVNAHPAGCLCCISAAPAPVAYRPVLWLPTVRIVESPFIGAGAL